MKALRPWATPLTIGTTLVTLATGVLLFFHAAPGLTRLSHEWIGMIMVVAVVAHLLLNWRPFKAYFARPIGLALIALGVVATVLTFAVTPQRTGGPGGSPMAMIMGTMGKAEIGDIAVLARKDVESVLAALASVGTQATATTTLKEAAGGNRAAEMEILQVILK